MTRRHRREANETLADIELGTAGASARTRYEALRRHDDERLRKRFGCVAPLLRLIAGPNATTQSWGRGAAGEERIGSYLSRAVGHRGVLLHDRSIPGRRANIDHVAVVPSGVWVIDSKNYRGNVEQRRVRRWFRGRDLLHVAGRNRSAQVAAILEQGLVVAEIVGSEAPVRSVLCITGADWPTFEGPFTVDDVLITWPRALGRTLCANGTLDREARTTLARRLSHAFPPYGARPGTGFGGRPCAGRRRP